MRNRRLGRSEQRALWSGLVLVSLLVMGSLAAPALALPQASAPAMSLSLGAGTVTLQGTALAGLTEFDMGPAGATVETASATAHNPYREVTITEVPFGSIDQDDPALGPAASGSAPRARASLAAFRQSQHAVSLGTPQAEIFGAQVTGAAHLVQLAVDGPSPVATVLVEWVAEAQGSLWLLRVAEELASPGSLAQAQTVLPRLADISVTAGATGAGARTSVYLPDTSGAALGPTVTGASQAGTGPMPPLAPTPSWWSGTCDTNNYSAAAQTLVGQALPAYPLSAGATWDGLTACGPRPYYNEGPDVSVHFPGAQWGVLEWECVELSMRWMYEEWHVEPYPANGSGVVWNYAGFKSQYNPNGPALQAVANDGNGPLPAPGDVLSYGATSTAGHTSVVTAVSIDGNGNGYVTVLEENASSTGWDSVSVSGWVLGGFDGGVTGWLHNPAIRSGGGRAPEPAARGRNSALPPSIS